MTAVDLRVAVQCVFRHEGRILVFEQLFARAGRRALRAVGGGAEPGETPEQALVREVREELAREIESLRLLGTLEIRDPWWGYEPLHRVHVFDARFADAATYALDIVEGADADGTVIRARWRTPDDIAADPLPFVPEGIDAIVREAR